MNGHITRRGEEVVVLLDEPTSLSEGTAVDVRVSRPRGTIERLVADISGKNRHEDAWIEDPAIEAAPDEGTTLVIENLEEIAAIDPTAHMTLAEMIERITPETLHDYIDFGPPVGKEVW